MADPPRWTTALPDWERRIVARESMLPCEPLFPSEAAEGMRVFDELRLVDVVGQPTMGQVSRPWVREFVASIFGAYDPESGRRLIREWFLLISKKNTKSTTAAAVICRSGRAAGASPTASRSRPVCGSTTTAATCRSATTPRRSPT